jgi:hypothetical protein
MAITSNGNVGIGTSPENKLHISDVVTDNTKLILQNNFVYYPLPTEIVVPGTISTILGTSRCIIFPYTSDSLGLTGQTQYTFTPTENLAYDILVVGGGGGGGRFGGGGGSGAILFSSNFILEPNNAITIKTGNGGLGTRINNGVNGVNGTDSSITIKSIEYIAKGGGGGGTRGVTGTGSGSNGSDGGSGGGGSQANPSPQALGGISTKLNYANFISFGNNGGRGKLGTSGGEPSHASGGGGGAGGVGGDFIPTIGGGNGGLGKDFTEYFGAGVGHNGWFGGGGGGNTYQGAGTRGFANGGNGLFGGGGNGSFDWNFNTELTADNGMSNTGGGGGGGKADGYPEETVYGGTGGTGVVIIRYRNATSTIASTVSSASIDFTRGLPGDANTDYKLGNYSGDFRIMSSASNVDTNRLLLTSNGDITVSGSINAASRYLLGGRNILEDTSNYVLSTSNIINEKIANLNSSLLSVNENSVNTIITETGAKVSLLCNTMLAIGKLNNNNLNTTVTSFTENTTAKFVLLCNTMLAIGKLNDANISNYILASSLATSNKILADVKAVNTTVSRTDNLEVNGNLTVNSNLIVLGDSTRLETIVYTTERLEVVNANNTSTALMVQQNTPNRDIFVASNMSSSVFRVANNGDININGRLGIGTATPATPLHVIGDIVATNNITSYYSDERLKTRVADISEALKIVNKLNGFYYIPNELARINGITNTDREIGLSAQDVQRVLPEIVKIAPFDLATDAEGNKISRSGEKYLTMSYERLAPVFVEAIKELEQKNNVLEQKNNVLEQKNNELTDKYNILLEDITIIKKKLELP